MPRAQPGSVLGSRRGSYTVQSVLGEGEFGAVYEAVATRRGGRPFFLVAKTVKGRGVSYMESVPIWHYRAPNPKEYQQAIDELQEIAS